MGKAKEKSKSSGKAKKNSEKSKKTVETEDKTIQVDFPQWKDQHTNTDYVALRAKSVQVEIVCPHAELVSRAVQCSSQISCQNVKAPPPMDCEVTPVVPDYCSRCCSLRCRPRPLTHFCHNMNAKTSNSKKSVNSPHTSDTGSKGARPSKSRKKTSPERKPTSSTTTSSAVPASSAFPSNSLQCNADKPEIRQTDTSSLSFKYSDLAYCSPKLDGVASTTEKRCSSQLYSTSYRQKSSCRSDSPFTCLRTYTPYCNVRKCEPRISLSEPKKEIEKEKVVKKAKVVVTEDEPKLLEEEKPMSQASVPVVEEKTQEPDEEEKTQEPVVEEKSQEPVVEEKSQEPVGEEETQEPVVEEITKEPDDEEKEKPLSQASEPVVEENTKDPVVEEEKYDESVQEESILVQEAEIITDKSSSPSIQETEDEISKEQDIPQMVVTDKLVFESPPCPRISCCPFRPQVPSPKAWIARPQCFQVCEFPFSNLTSRHCSQMPCARQDPCSPEKRSSYVCPDIPYGKLLSTRSVSSSCTSGGISIFKKWKSELS